MLSDIVTVGNKIDIKQLDQMGRPVKAAKTYVSKLMDYMNEDTISIAMPLSNNHLVILNPGEKYNLCFYTGKGLYQCNCEMQQIYKENNTLIASVRLTSDLEKYQRRQYYRLECSEDIEYRIVTKDELLLEHNLNSKLSSEAEKSEIKYKLSQLPAEWLKASICDLSGGGIRFSSDQLHDPGDKIKIRMNFITKGTLNMHEFGADIIASYKLLNRSSRYEHRAEFYDISKKDRECLIKYIFEQERLRRKKQKPD